MSPTPHIQLLGDFALTWDGVHVEGLGSPRLQSLLAYLLLHRDAAQSRQRLAFIFWPESVETQARNNLRQLLHTIRHMLPAVDSFLIVDAQSVWWRRDAPIRLDVEEFEHVLVEIEQADRHQDYEALRRAGEELLALYRADLLPGCYDEWIEPERERLRERFLQALFRLIQVHEARQEYETAIRYARRMVRADALNEDAYRCLMRLLAMSGNRTGELRAYQECESTLRRELGIAPSEATVTLHQRLLELQVAAPNQDIHREGAVPVRARSASSSLVGREREWETLRRAWRTMRAHGPGFVLITGEPGIGKSRLAEEMASRVRHQGITTAVARSYALEGDLAFAPVIEWLRSADLRPHVRQLERVWLAEVARILPELFMEFPDLPHYEPMNEYGQRLRFFQALAHAVLAAPQPRLLIIDDLQWCDQETLEWLHFLLRFDAQARVLVVGMARSEEATPNHPLHLLMLHLRHTIDVTEIELQPLDAAESAELAGRMTGQALDTETAMRLFGETEGNPLFIVEAVRAGLDDLLKQRTVGELTLVQPISASLALPKGVRSVIGGRLSQLSAPARELAELAATVGRQFSLDILLRVSQSDEEDIVRALAELFQRRIIREQGPAAYDFAHDKIREVAYGEISAPQRHLWHRRIARALEEMLGDDLDPASGQIAAHYERGGSIERAIPYYHRAALVAHRVFAHEDAIRLIRHCLALLEQMPPGTARDKQELTLLLVLAPLYRITRGWTVPELERVMERTLALCETVAEDPQRAEALYGLQSLLVVQAHLEQVESVAEQVHTLYERLQGSVPALSDIMLTGARLHSGHLSEANEAFERILATHDGRLSATLEDSQGWNFIVHSHAWQAHALWCLGYPERSLQIGSGAVQLAQSLGQPFNQALATTYLAMLCQMGADAATARTRAEEALALSIEYKAPYYRAWAAILVAYSYAREHPDETTIAALCAAIDELTSTGVRLRLPYYLSLLASTYGLAGHSAEGLARIDSALAQAAKSTEHWWDAELWRVRGELLLTGHQGVREAREAEEALLHAADIARSQQSRSLELRALLAFARLCTGSERMGEMLGRLRDVYTWFTEGFDTPDLRAAQSLLSERR